MFQTLFASLTQKNRLCRQHGFRFTMVSDLDGFSEALETMQASTPLICLSDCTSGAIEIDNSPAVRTVMTLFMYMPHPIRDNFQARRQEALRTMREIFRQFMTVLIREAVNLRLQGIYLDPEVTFNEIDRYFHSGGACAYFQIATDKSTDLRLRPDEWTENPIPHKTGRLDVNTPRPSTQPSSECGTRNRISFSDGPQGNTKDAPES